MLWVNAGVACLMGEYGWLMARHMGMMRRLAQAQSQLRCARPQTGAELSAMSRGVRRGLLCQPYRGMYVQLECWNALDPLERTRYVVRTLALMHPDWIFCGPTAAIMYRLDCSYRFAMPVCITVPGQHGGVSSSKLKRYAIADPEPRVWNGIRLTSLRRTLVDCAIRLPLRYALSPVESAVRNGWIDRDALRLFVAGMSYLRGRGQALRVIEMAEGLSENGGEAECKVVLDRLGFPVDGQQVEFPCLSMPNRRHRVDYYWRRDDGSVVVGELDGLDKYVDPSMTGGRGIRSVVDDERDRQECLARQKADTVRMYYSDLSRQDRLLSRLERNRVPRRGVRPYKLSQNTL